MKVYDRQRVILGVTSATTPIVIGTLMVFVFLGGFSAWAFSVPLSGAIIAQGTVITDGNVQIVRHERGGVLSTLLVKEGQTVNRGEVLATISRAEDRSAVEELKTRIASLSVKQSRLLDEQAGKADFTIAPSDLGDSASQISNTLLDELVDDQRQEFLSRQKQLADALEVLSAQRLSLEKQIIGAEAELEAMDKQQQSLEIDIKLRRDAATKGLGRETVLRELERESDGLTGRILKAQAGKASLQYQIDETDSRMAAERSGFMEKVGNDLSRIRAERLQALEALTGKADTVSRIEVRAPVDGIINKLHFSTVGSAIEPFAPMLEIIAGNQPLLIEAKIEPSDIDAVYPGQDANAVLSAFNRRTYDPVAAKVTFVGADARRDRPDQPLYYTIRLSVDDDERSKLPHIVPGMPSEVYLVTKERTFADYIAEPFIQSFQRSFRQ